jgi:hypothetical protein
VRQKQPDQIYLEQQICDLLLKIGAIFAEAERLQKYREWLVERGIKLGLDENLVQQDILMDCVAPLQKERDELVRRWEIMEKRRTEA